MRTANSRTYQNSDGTLTTEFHAQPIFHQPEGSAEWEPIDLRLVSDEDEGQHLHGHQLTGSTGARRIRRPRPAS